MVEIPIFRFSFKIIVRTECEITSWCILYLTYKAGMCEEQLYQNIEEFVLFSPSGVWGRNDVSLPPSLILLLLPVSPVTKSSSLLVQSRHSFSKCFWVFLFSFNLLVSVNLILPRPNAEYGKNALVIVEQHYGILFLVTLGDRETCAGLESV